MIFIFNIFFLLVFTNLTYTRTLIFPLIHHQNKYWYNFLTSWAVRATLKIKDCPMCLHAKYCKPVEDQPEHARLQKTKTRITKKTTLIFPVQMKDLFPMVTSEKSLGWRITKPHLIPGSLLGSAPFRQGLPNKFFFHSVPPWASVGELWLSRRSVFIHNPVVI